MRELVKWLNSLPAHDPVRGIAALLVDHGSFWAYDGERLSCKTVADVKVWLRRKAKDKAV